MSKTWKTNFCEWKSTIDILTRVARFEEEQKFCTLTKRAKLDLLDNGV
jgi:hypothetical protein